MGSRDKYEEAKRSHVEKFIPSLYKMTESKRVSWKRKSLTSFITKMPNNILFEIGTDERAMRNPGNPSAYYVSLSYVSTDNTIVRQVERIGPFMGSTDINNLMALVDKVSVDMVLTLLPDLEKIEEK